MKKSCVAAAVLAAAWVTFGEVPVWPEFPAEMVVEKEIPAGDPVTLDVGELAGKALLRKTGPGKLVIAADNSAFTGRIDIVEGVLRVEHSDALGDKVGATVVKNGATLEVYGTVKNYPLLGKEPCYFEGEGVTGPDGQPWGALHSSHTKSNDGNNPIWPRKWILTGDALVKGEKGNQDFNSGCSVDMNFHTLSIYAVSDYERYAFDCTNPGHIRLLNKGAVFTVKNTGCGGLTNTVTMTDGSHIYFNANGGMPWTIKQLGSSYLYVGSGTGCWDGDLDLSTMASCQAQDKKADNVLVFRGIVHGVGGFRSASKVPALKLNSAKNDFKGGVAFSGQTLRLDVDGALPKDGGLLAMTNAAVELLRSEDTYHLPAAEFYGTGVVSGASAVWTRTVTKKGAGEWALPKSTFNEVDIQEGRLRIATPGGGVLGSAAGVWQGWTNGWWTTQTEGLPAVKGVYFCLTNELVNSANWTLTNSKPHAGEPGDGGAYSYSGYLVNNEPTNVNWTISVNVRARTKLFVNGVQVVDQQWGPRVAKRIQLSPGANPFILETCCNTKDVGPGTVNNNYFDGNSPVAPPNSSFDYKGGFLIDRQGRDPACEALISYPGEWEQPVDTGDGSFLRVAKDVAEAEALGLVPSRISRLRIVNGACFEAAGWPVHANTLVGLGAISNVTAHVGIEKCTDVFFDWHVSTGDILRGCCFTTDSKLTFRAGTKLRLYSAAQIKKGSFRIATAAGGIAGLPTVIDDQGNDLSRYATRLDANGKDLWLDVEPKGLQIFIK